MSQIEVLSKLEQVWDQYDYFVIDAPTGVGKSHIALALGQALGAFILTSTKALQDQYMQTSTDIKNLKGRSNYTCAVNTDFHCGAAPCQILPDLYKECMKAARCPYVNAREDAIAADVMITNYAFFLYSALCGFLARAEDPSDVIRKVCVMDEAHNLENSLVSFAETRFNLPDLASKLGVSDPDWIVYGDQRDAELLELVHIAFVARKANLQEKLNDILRDEIGDTTNVNLKKLAGQIRTELADRVKKLYKRIDELDKFIKPLDLYEETKDEEWLIHGNPADNTITLTPINGGFLFHKFVKPWAKKHVLMSATIGDPEVFCDEYRLPKDKTCIISVSSDFPPEKSPVIVIPQLKMGWKDIDKSIPKMIDLIEAIMDQHKDECGIIHCATYKLQNAILDGITKKNRARLLARDMDRNKRYTNQELMELHELNSNRQSVLLSPSLIEGTDLKDELGRFQVIVKLPWSSVGDIRVEVKSKLNNDWYTNDMWNKILQASGRSTRHNEDFSTTYVLDASFDWFFGKWKHKLPEWFTRRVVK